MIKWVCGSQQRKLYCKIKIVLQEKELSFILYNLQVIPKTYTKTLQVLQKSNTTQRMVSD